MVATCCRGVTIAIALSAPVALAQNTSAPLLAGTAPAHVTPHLPSRSASATNAVLAGKAAAHTPQLLRHMNHRSWGQSDGLAINGAGVMQRSDDGYLWIQARDGVLRFDGVRFVLLDSAASPALRSDSVGQFVPRLADRDGGVWFSRPDGALVRYHNGMFAVTLAPDGVRRPVWGVLQDKTGRIWITTNHGLYWLVGSELARPVLPSGLLASNIRSVIRDTGSGLWFGTTGGVWHMNANKAQYFASPGPPSRADLTPLHQMADGRLWAGNAALYTFGDNRWSAVKLGNREVLALAVDETPDGQAVIATRGFGLLNVFNGRMERFGQRDGLSSSVLLDLHVDAEGSIWVSTESGLDRFRVSPFVTLGSSDHVPFDAPFTLLGDALGGLWVSTLGDGRVYRGVGGIVDARDDEVRWTEARFDPSGEKGDIIGSAFDGGVWSRYGSRPAVTLLGNPSRRVGRQFEPPTGSEIWHGFRDTKGNLWATFRGGGVARVRDGALAPLRLSTAARDRTVMCVVEDARGHLWMSDNSRPVIYEVNGGIVIATIDSTSGLTESIDALVSTNVDTLWAIGSRGALYRIVGHAAQRVDLPGGRTLFAAGSLNAVLERDNVWIGTSRGITRLSLSALNQFADGRGPAPQPRAYSGADGLSTPRITGSINYQGAFAAPDGRVWFSTPAGIAVYDAANDRRNTIAPRARVEEIVVSGKVLRDGGPVVIPANPEGVEIHYTAASLRMPERVRIQHRLEGADPGWVEGNPQRVAVYPQLRAGHYQFRVRALNEDGVASVNDAVLAIRVMPAWYETSWFLTIALLTLVSAGPIVVNNRLKARATSREQRLRERFDATLAERARLARELHDTLLQGFTGITLKLQAVQASLPSEPHAASEVLARVLDESDITLLDARQMIWDMRMPELDNHELCSALETAARSAVANTGIALQFRVHGMRRRCAPMIESTVFRVCREAVVNAVKYAHCSAVEIDVRYTARAMELQVTDNGIGIPPSVVEGFEQNGHMGIPGMRERAARAGGTCTISAAENGGTQVTVTLTCDSSDIRPT